MYGHSITEQLLLGQTPSAWPDLAAAKERCCGTLGQQNRFAPGVFAALCEVEHLHKAERADKLFSCHRQPRLEHTASNCTWRGSGWKQEEFLQRKDC